VSRWARATCTAMVSGPYPRAQEECDVTGHCMAELPFSLTWLCFHLLPLVPEAYARAWYGLSQHFACILQIGISSFG